ncbi:MAG: methyltransferase [Byssovorax sp.]
MRRGPYHPQRADTKASCVVTRNPRDRCGLDRRAQASFSLRAMLFDVQSALDGVLHALLPVRDILDGRVDDVDPPAWCVDRGWVEFLLALGDDELRRCEAEGLAARADAMPGAPASLVALAADVLACTALPTLTIDRRAAPPSALRSVSERKREQLAALLGAVGPMAARAARIVDVGAGEGHFTRLAAELFDREALGIERSEIRVASATARAQERANEIDARGSVARFVALDACKEPLELAADDLAVGLHACGEVGDRLITAAAAAGCEVALVSCCLQKIAGPTRAPLSRAAQGLTLRKDTLGLTNLTAQPRGIEASLDATLEARQVRFALLRLLRARGVVLAPGEEMRGINRRRAHRGLRDVAERALAQRALPGPTDAEIADHEEESRRLYGVVRRLALPRSMLARLVEIAVVLDRAAALAESGARITVATFVERAVTPRNIVILASR